MDKNDWLTTKQVADLKGVLYGTVCRVIREGSLPAARFGHAWMILREDAERWIPESQMVEISKKDLTRMYWDESKGITDIFKETGIARMVIHRLMKRFDIPRRNLSESHKGFRQVDHMSPEKQEQWRANISKSKQGISPWNYMTSERRAERRKELSTQMIERWETGILGNDEHLRKQRESHRGEKCWRWQGGSDHYRGENWQEQRDKIRERDNFTCQRCGVTETDLGQELDVHHKIPFVRFSDYKDANQLSNLICYCKTCHSIEDHALNGNGKS